jgi:polyisoprenoid-binding protein YceI
MRRVVLCATAIVVCAIPSFAAGSTWKIDSAHSSAQFAVRHLMISTVRGTMGPVTGTVNIDEADLAKSSVEASVDVTGLNTREPKRDAHLKSADFFDTEKYPTITFKSKNVTKVSDTKYKVAGDLTIHGVTKEVVLDVAGSPKPVQDPMAKVQKLGGSATTTLNRKDFGITFNSVLEGGGVLIGNDVDVTIDIELIKQP